MNVYEAAVRRRAIRRFRKDPVPYDVLERCVDAGRVAPNGHNHQILEFIVIDDEEKLSNVLTCFVPLRDPLDVRDLPLPGQYPQAFIVILINTVLESDTGAPRWAHMISVGMAAENAILVAQENGLGTCPLMGFESGALKQVLGIPDEYDIGLLISLGYAAESAVADETSGSVERWTDDQGVRHVPKRRLADILHHNKFTKSDYNKQFLK